MSEAERATKTKPTQRKGGVVWHALGHSREEPVEFDIYYVHNTAELWEDGGRWVGSASVSGEGRKKGRHDRACP